MTRKEFVTAIAAAGAVPACASAADDAAQAAAAADRFKQQWVASLVASLDSQLAPAERVKVMEACGRACARRGAGSSLAKAAGGDIDKLLAALSQHLGQGNARREGDTVHLRYAKCYCPLVGAAPERLSRTFCECSRGWVLEVFGAITGKPVKVEILSSIKAGDPDCRFQIRIGA